jgi:hypothetical protein
MNGAIFHGGIRADRGGRDRASRVRSRHVVKADPNARRVISRTVQRVRVSPSCQSFTLRCKRPNGASMGTSTGCQRSGITWIGMPYCQSMREISRNGQDVLHQLH